MTEKKQALFDNNFNIMNGPDAPDLEIRELDKELIISLTNKESSNNFNEKLLRKRSLHYTCVKCR